MPIIKKLLFAPLFLLFLGLTFYQVAPILSSKDFLFSLDSSLLITLIMLTSSIILTGLFYVIFITICQDWRLVLPVVLLSILPQVMFLPLSQALVTSLWILILLLITFITLNNKLKTYVDFRAGQLLTPSVKAVSGFLILIICVTYFLSLTNIIKKEGFEVPDALIEYAMTLIPTDGLDAEIDPKVLQSSDVQELIKDTLKVQFQEALNPYLSYLPGFLAILLFFTLKSIDSFLSILISPLISLIFSILEKAGFTKFTTEMRSVKKMVI